MNRRHLEDSRSRFTLEEDPAILGTNLRIQSNSSSSADGHVIVMSFAVDIHLFTNHIYMLPAHAVLHYQAYRRGEQSEGRILHFGTAFGTD
jgi:hypothetical protein